MDTSSWVTALSVTRRKAWCLRAQVHTTICPIFIESSSTFVPGFIPAKRIQYLPSHSLPSSPLLPSDGLPCTMFSYSETQDKEDVTTPRSHMDLTLAGILQRYFLHSLHFAAKSSFRAYSKPVMAGTYIQRGSCFPLALFFFCDSLFCLQFMVIMNLLEVKWFGKYHSDYIHNRFTPFPDSVCFLQYCHATPTSPLSKSVRCHQHISYSFSTHSFFLTLSHLRPSFSKCRFLVYLFGVTLWLCDETEVPLEVGNGIYMHCAGTLAI